MYACFATQSFFLADAESSTADPLSPPPLLANAVFNQEHTPPLVIELHPTWWRVRTASTERQGQGHKKTANLQYCYSSRQVKCRCRYVQIDGYLLYHDLELF